MNYYLKSYAEMWASSSSAFVGINRDSETALQSIGQYIEDYIDLVENVPNDVVRGITQLHEKNHVYQRLLDRLGSTMEKAADAAVIQDEEGRKNTLLLIQKYLIQIQSVADDKLYCVQSIYEQLEMKSRQLEHDIRSISVGSGNSTIVSPIKPREGGRHSSNQFVANSVSESRHPVASNSDSSQDSSENSPDPSENNSQGETGVTRPNRTREKKARDGAADAEENDGDDEEPCVTDSPRKSEGNKRTRRTVHHTRNGRGRGGADEERSEETRGGRKKAVGRVGHRESREPKRSRRGAESPPSFLDDSVDPDEPTYCLCRQVCLEV